MPDEFAGGTFCLRFVGMRYTQYDCTVLVDVTVALGASPWGGGG